MISFHFIRFGSTRAACEYGAPGIVITSWCCRVAVFIDQMSLCTLRVPCALYPFHDLTNCYFFSLPLFLSLPRLIFPSLLDSFHVCVCVHFAGGNVVSAIFFANESKQHHTHTEFTVGPNAIVGSCSHRSNTGGCGKCPIKKCTSKSKQHQHRHHQQQQQQQQQ